MRNHRTILRLRIFCGVVLCLFFLQPHVFVKHLSLVLILQQCQLSTKRATGHGGFIQNVPAGLFGLVRAPLGPDLRFPPFLQRVYRPDFPETQRILVAAFYPEPRDFRDFCVVFLFVFCLFRVYLNLWETQRHVRSYFPLWPPQIGS